MIKSKFCNDLTSDCTFELVKYIMGEELSPNYKDVHSIVFCQVGQLTIISNLFPETMYHCSIFGKALVSIGRKIEII